MSNKSNQCPFCAKNSINREKVIEKTGDRTTMPVWKCMCNNCKRTWKERA